MSAQGGRPETIEDLRDVLLRGGFVPCDSAVCGCGSWHHRYGYPERMREIQEILDDAGHPLTNANGNLLRNAVAALIAERDALRQQPAPVVDDARMARALEWVRTAARGNVGEGDALRAALIESARKHLPAIEEAIAAYDPNCGARTVRGVDDAMVERYLTAVHEHLGGLPSDQWDRDREDGGSTLRRIARIGLTAAIACAQGVQS